MEIPHVQSMVQDIMNNQLYDPEEHDMENTIQNLTRIQLLTTQAREKLKELCCMEDTIVNREIINSLEIRFFSCLASYSMTAYRVLATVQELNLANGALAMEDDVEMRELGLEETTLKKSEYTQKDKDKGRLICSVCRDTFKLTECLQGCPQCGQLFHEECILDNLKYRHVCPLCRFDLEKVDDDNAENTTKHNL